MTENFPGWGMCAALLWASLLLLDHMKPPKSLEGSSVFWVHTFGSGEITSDLAGTRFLGMSDHTAHILPAPG